MLTLGVGGDKAMIFDTMKPEFGWQLLVFGSLCLVFLLSGVRAGFQRNGQHSSNLKAAAYLSLATVFAIAFIGTTAPSQAYGSFLRVLLVCACALSAVICAVTAAVFLRTNKVFFEPAMHYKDFLDDIDDDVFILDSLGEQVLQNKPNGRERLSPEIVQSLPTAFLSGEQKIIWDNRSYMVSASVIRDKKERKAGVVLIFHDITREQQLIDELETKNDLLARTNEELRQAIAVDEALLAQARRERLAAEIRQELESKMNATLHYINALESTRAQGRAQKEKNLHSLAKQLRSVLADIRRIVYKTKEH